MITQEQKAWQLWENGVTFAEIATHAALFEKTFEESVEDIWQTKIQEQTFCTQKGMIVFNDD